MKKVLLDTSGYIELLKGDERIYDLLSDAEKVFFSVISLGELYAGYKGGTKEKYNLSILRKFLSKQSVSVVNITDETAKIFAWVKNGLRKKGKAVPINDVWISANAFETGSAIITFDSHFRNVDGLRICEL